MSSKICIDFKLIKTTTNWHYCYSECTTFSSSVVFWRHKSKACNVNRVTHAHCTHAPYVVLVAAEIIDRLRCDDVVAASAAVEVPARFDFE